MSGRNSIRIHCARFDHGGCGLKVEVENGLPVRVVPDRDDPFSHGYACPKGLSALDRLRSPHRLTRPLKRGGSRGEGRWEAVSWDEAFERLTRAFSSAMERHGPEGVSFAQGAPKGPEFFMLLRLANLLNCPNVAGTQHVCHMPREQAATVTCGFFPVPDLASPTQCVLLWGSNPAATNEEGVLGEHLTRCLKSGPKLIVVDPFRTRLAERADVWLQLRPATDDILALGLLHLIVEEELHDETFVHQWTVGFDELKEAVRPYTPDRVSRDTWVPKAALLEAARAYGRASPALIHWGNAVEHTPNTAGTCRSLVLLMAVTGNLEVPGGNVRAQAPPLMRLSDFIALKRFPDRPKKLLNRHHGIIPRLITVPNWMVVDSILDQSPYPIRCLYTQGTNPLLTYSDAQRVFKALHALDFIAVADQVMTPTAALADLVLPVALPMEYDDIGHYGLPHGHIFARPKVVDAVGECRSDLAILNEWGKRMGFSDDFWEDPADILEDILKPSGLTYRQFAQAGILRGAERYRTYEEKGFATPSGKVELRSSLFEQWGFDPLPSPDSPEPLRDDYPLVLTSRKPRYFFHSAYRHVESLRRRHDRPEVRIHPETASRLGIADGDRVQIATKGGAVFQTARLTEGLDPRVILADYGWWFPERTQDPLRGWKEANLNVLTSTDGPKDPVMGTPRLRGIPCRIEKA